MNVALKESEMGLEAPLVVSKIFDNCLYSGFFGSLDSERIKTITEKMLDATEALDCERIIIDLSNVDVIDTAIAGYLLRIIKSLGFSGVAVILCGIKGYVAQTMSLVEIDLGDITITKDLRGALRVVYEKSGYELMRKK